MTFNQWIFMFIPALFLLMPLHASAADYSITGTTIDAFLQEDGSVDVEESHTYEFDGDFNGITRELFPKEGTNITDLKAEENGESLEVEKEETMYRIFRGGEDETITVDISYHIEDGVDVFPDTADFYWPFFDSSNESEYENVIVTVHPPAQTDEVIAFGYDEAFETEEIQSNGSVIFDLGEVPEGTKGDIRTAYDKELFPAASLTADQPMRDNILAEQEEGIESAAAREHMQDRLTVIGWAVLPVISLALLGFWVMIWIRTQMKYAAVKRDFQTAGRIPRQKMSLPATLVYTNYQSLPSEAQPAALLDLVRKGYVEKLSDTRFRVLTRDGALAHEKVLLNWLFDEIGKDGEFSFDDLKAFTKNKKNHAAYRSIQNKWQKEIKNEVKIRELYEDYTKWRWIFGVAGLIMIPPTIIFPIFGLLGGLFVSLLLLIALIATTVFLNIRTVEGAEISYEWRKFKEEFKNLTPAEWNAWSEDERMRAFIYGIGINDKSLRRKNEELLSLFKNSTASAGGSLQSAGTYSGADLTTIALVAPIASSSFQSANASANPAASSSGGTGGGTGAGGGGGGSGAF
ncbi:DUF2207 domain-containing protein [Alteribacillus sp. HJP-4]|uniref:DUF2207 domain-containing protein n=1 Tax=Alteribacillus sp. HJP-4 TaxID=2775394 RepID=UPI0035CD36A8